MKKLFILLALSAGFVSLNAIDQDYFNETDAFFQKLQVSYGLTLCKKIVSMEEAQSASKPQQEKIATYQWIIQAQMPQAFLATVSFDSSLGEDFKIRALNDIDKHFNTLKNKDAHIQLRSQTTTPVGDVIAQYQNPKYDSEEKRAGGQGKVVEVRLVP